MYICYTWFCRMSAFRNWAAWEGLSAILDLPFVGLGLAFLGSKSEIGLGTDDATMKIQGGTPVWNR